MDNKEIDWAALTDTFFWLWTGHIPLRYIRRRWTISDLEEENIHEVHLIRILFNKFSLQIHTLTAAFLQYFKTLWKNSEDCPNNQAFRNTLKINTVFIILSYFISNMSCGITYMFCGIIKFQTERKDVFRILQLEFEIESNFECFINCKIFQLKKSTRKFNKKSANDSSFSSLIRHLFLFKLFFFFFFGFFIDDTKETTGRSGKSIHHLVNVDRKVKNTI